MTKTALLTGGSRGIGAATAELLRARGWDIDAPSSNVLDFADVNSINIYLLDWLRGLAVPHYNAIVFCHGEWYSRSPWQSPRVDPAMVWYRQFSMRVFNPLMILQFLISGDPRWRPDCVVMVSSTRGLIGGLDTGPYAAACAAQIALMQGYAREYGSGIRFNVVAPGLTDTALGAQVRATGGAKPDAVAQPPEAVAAEIVRLIESDDNGRVMRIVNGLAERMAWQVEK